MKNGLSLVVLSSFLLVSCSSLTQESSSDTQKACLETLAAYDHLFEGKVNVFFKEEVTWNDAIAILHTHGLEKAIGQTPHTDPLEQKARRTEIQDADPQQQEAFKYITGAQENLKNMPPSEKEKMTQQIQEAFKSRGVDLDNPSAEMKAKNEEVMKTIEQSNQQTFLQSRTMTAVVPIGQEKIVACALKDDRILKVLPVQLADIFNTF